MIKNKNTMSINTKCLTSLSGMDHVGLTVPDLEAAVLFYTTLLNAKEVFRVGPLDSKAIGSVDGKDWGLAFFNVEDACFRLIMLELEDGSRLELFQYDRPTDKKTQHPRVCDIGGYHIGFKVKSLDQVMAMKDEFGLKFLAGPLDASDVGVKIIYAIDPWGNYIELVERVEVK